MQYLREAAEGGHRAAMIELAKTLDTGGEGEDKRYTHTHTHCCFRSSEVSVVVTCTQS